MATANRYCHLIYEKTPQVWLKTKIAVTRRLEPLELRKWPVWTQIQNHSDFDISRVVMLQSRQTNKQTNQNSVFRASSSLSDHYGPWDLEARSYDNRHWSIRWNCAQKKTLQWMRLIWTGCHTDSALLQPLLFHSFRIDSFRLLKISKLWVSDGRCYIWDKARSSSCSN